MKSPRRRRDLPIEAKSRGACQSARIGSTIGHERQKRPALDLAARSGRAPCPRRRIAIIKGQDTSRFTDFYHAVLRAPWWVFFLGPGRRFRRDQRHVRARLPGRLRRLEHARPGNFWDAFLFSVQTIGSINYSVMVPKTTYVNMVVIVEAFVGYTRCSRCSLA